MIHPRELIQVVVGAEPVVARAVVVVVVIPAFIGIVQNSFGIPEWTKVGDLGRLGDRGRGGRRPGKTAATHQPATWPPRSPGQEPQPRVSSTDVLKDQASFHASSIKPHHLGQEFAAGGFSVQRDSTTGQSLSFSMRTLRMSSRFSVVISRVPVTCPA